MTDPKAHALKPAEALHGKLFVNSEVRKRNWPGTYEEAIGEIAAALDAAYEDGKRNASPSAESPKEHYPYSFVKGMQDWQDEMRERINNLGVASAEAAPGWQLVPKEPTQEMREACRNVIADSLGTGEETLVWYKAMLAAAPATPAPAKTAEEWAEEIESGLWAYEDRLQNYIKVIRAAQADAIASVKPGGT